MKTISRQEQLERLRQRYKDRGHEGRSRMLDELCEQHGCHRKHAIRLLNGKAGPRRSPPGPERQYTSIAELVERIWAAGEQPCGKRLEAAELVAPINDIYEQLWGPLHNFFLPSMKLVEKHRIGARWQRKHDQPQTAYQRLLKMKVLSARKKRELRDLYESLDPFVLHEQLDKALRPILAKAVEAN